MEVLNSIEHCLDKAHYERPHGHGYLGAGVHRTESGHNAAGIARKHRLYDKIGFKMAYTFTIDPDGVTEQALPLHIIGWHAKGHWGRTYVGIGCIGDFRTNEMPEAQYTSLVELCTWIAVEQSDVLIIQGHDELFGGSEDKAKECPGNLLDMDHLRSDVQSLASTHNECYDIGITA